MLPEIMSSSDEAQVADPEMANTNGSYVDKRKSSKPVMEKRRRARINNSLNQLKSILLEALKKDSTRHSKLEKADILEMTVNYLKNVERQRLSMSLSIDPSVLDKYRAGFNECRNEVMRFLSTCDGVTVDTRTNLLSHLASCIRCIQSLTTQTNVFDDHGFDSLPLPTSLLLNGTIHGLSTTTFSTVPLPNSVLTSGSLNPSLAESDLSNTLGCSAGKRLTLSETMNFAHSNLKRNVCETNNSTEHSRTKIGFVPSTTTIPLSSSQSYHYESQLNRIHLSPNIQKVSQLQQNVNPVFLSPSKSPEMVSACKNSTKSNDCFQHLAHNVPLASPLDYNNYQQSEITVGNTENLILTNSDKEKRLNNDEIKDTDKYSCKNHGHSQRTDNISNHIASYAYEHRLQSNKDRRQWKRKNSFHEEHSEKTKRKRLSKTNFLNDFTPGERNEQTKPINSADYNETMQAFFNPGAETQHRSSDVCQSFSENNRATVQTESSRSPNQILQDSDYDVNNNQSNSLSYNKYGDKRTSVKTSNPWRPWSDNSSVDKI